MNKDAAKMTLTKEELRTLLQALRCIEYMVEAYPEMGPIIEKLETMETEAP